MKEEIRSLLLKIHDQFDAHQFESPKDYLKKKHELLNSYLPENQFLSLFDITACEFAFVKPEVERVLGYKPEEFTFNTLISCIPHEHLVFFLQYGIISYEMIAAGDNVKILRHSYFTSFPM